jgi:hypothetical protein
MVSRYTLRRISIEFEFDTLKELRHSCFFRKLVVFCLVCTIIESVLVLAASSNSRIKETHGGVVATLTTHGNHSPISTLYNIQT